MSRKLWIALAVAVTVLAFGATTATAHRTSDNTEIEVEHVEASVGFIRIEGALNSPRDRCERFRRVVAFAVEREGDQGEVTDVTFIDADVTNLNGVFALQGPFPEGTDEIVLHTPREVLGSGDHRHICQADTHSFEWPDE